MYKIDLFLDQKLTVEDVLLRGPSFKYLTLKNKKMKNGLLLLICCTLLISKATLAHLAYHNTLTAPVNVKPSDGIFLEYAPISRDYTMPLSEEHLQNLKDNLTAFPAKTAHVLEYWLDASMFSRMIRVGRDIVAQVPWNTQNCERDVKLYTGLGLKSLTTFATWVISKDYIQNFGEQNTLNDLKEYGSVLRKYIK